MIGCSAYLGSESMFWIVQPTIHVCGIGDLKKLVKTLRRMDSKTVPPFRIFG
jgi:hypothetical protein